MSLRLTCPVCRKPIDAHTALRYAGRCYNCRDKDEVANDNPAPPSRVEELAKRKQSNKPLFEE